MIYPVDGMLWRGSRPEPVEFEYIRAQFKTVISLEGLEEDHKEVEELAPVMLISSPISAWEIYVTGIKQSVLNDILGAIESASKPVLIHCQHGEDRTGLIVAAYRVRVSGWEKGKAWQEALHYGYREWLNFGLNKTWDNFS